MGRYESKGEDIPVKRLLVLILALCLALPTALAEGFALEATLPLMDAAAASAMAREAQGRYCGVRPMAVDESEDGSAVRILGDVYLAEGQLEQLTDEQYARVQWLDRRAVVELRKSGDAWQVTSFALDAELEMEQAAQDYFTSAMVEYVDAERGFSIQYPAVFGEDAVTVDENGIFGQVENASFQVSRTANENSWTTETLLASKKQETPGAETNINDITGYGRLDARVGDEVLVCILIVTPEAVYQAQLRYHQSLSKDFSLYSDYMMNSFTVDELGLG